MQLTAIKELNRDKLFLNWHLKMQLKKTIEEYEARYDLPTTDVLKYGCTKLIERLMITFPLLAQG